MSPLHPDGPPAAYNDQGAATVSPRGAADADAELVRRMAEGDEEALGVVYDRFSALLHAVVLRITGDAPAAEEVLEEAFWQAWRQADRYQPGRGAVFSWLSTIARSRARDHVRARRRLREEPWDDVPESAHAHDGGAQVQAGPLADTERGEVREIVLRAVALLPREQRQTVEMAYFGGFSQTEIAQATGQPLGTVKTRARLALQKLREALSVLREDTR